MTRHIFLVWVDLLSVNLVVEIYSRLMLKQVGKFVYSLTLTSLSRFAHIRGCVLVELDNPLTDAVEADIPKVGTIQIDMTYKTLPFTCKYCKIGGHLDKLCSAK